MNDRTIIAVRLLTSVDYFFGNKNGNIDPSFAVAALHHRSTYNPVGVNRDAGVWIRAIPGSAVQAMHRATQESHMSIKRDAWGIEVGSQAIKVLKLSRTSTGVEMLDFDVLPFKQVLTTPDINVEEAIRVNLDALAQKHEFEKSNVVVSVPGNLAFARFAKLPPIEASKVKSIVAYEAQQQIPFPIDEVEWDYEVFAQEDAPDIEVGIFAITKERVAHFLSNYRAVGMDVQTLTLSPVAVYNAFAFENESGDGHGDNTVYLDIGTSSTDIIVVESGSIWLRTLQLGGNHFTQALMKQFKISFAKAEKLKLEAGTSKYAKQIYQAMRGVFSELVTEIQRSLGFYTSLNRDAELTKIVGVGSTWKLPGLQKYLKQNLQMQVVRPDGFSQLKIEDRRAAEFSSVAVNMATAYGLALQGLGMATVDANILPQSILQKRMWKAKQPWIGAAAACVAGAPAIGSAMLFLNGSSYDAAMGAVESDLNQTIAQATEFKNEYDTVQTTDPRPGIRNFRRSFDYTDLYPKLMSDVAAAMATIKPHPDLTSVNWNDPGDVKRAGAIERPMRDMVWISEVQTQYLPPKVKAGSASSDEHYDRQDFEQFGFEQAGPLSHFESSPPKFATLDTASSGVTPQLIPVVPFPEQQQPTSTPQYDPNTGEEIVPAPAAQGKKDYAADPAPRILVTVRGVTTMDRARISRALQQDFVGWLKTESEREDRPYILVPELSDPRFNRRSVTATDNSSGNAAGMNASGLRRTPTPKTEAQPNSLPQPGLTGGLSGLGGPGNLGGGSSKLDNQFVEVKTPEGWYASLGTSGGFSIDMLLPRRPLSVEDNSNDVEFKFSFEVILLAPDDVRKTVLTENGGQAPEEDEPTAPAEDSPQARPNTATQGSEGQV